MKQYFIEHIFPYKASRVGYAVSRGGILFFLGFAVWLLQRHVTGASWDGDDLFRAAMSTLSAFLLGLPLYFHMYTEWKNRITGNERGVIEVLMAIMLAGNGIGSLGFYRSLQYYDMGLHFFFPILTGICIAIVLNGWFQNRVDPSQIAVRTVSIIALCVLLWEGYEWTGDTFLGTAMLGQNGEELDTVYDIIAGVIALIPIYFASIFIARKRNR